MRIKEILAKANKVKKVLHVKSKEVEKEGDVQITLVILKDTYFNKKKVNIIKEVYHEAMFDRSILLADSQQVEIYSIGYKNPVELEIVLLGAEKKYNVSDFHVVTEE